MYSWYFWALVSLLLRATVAQKTYAIDHSCPPRILSVISEAINELLPIASSMENDARLDKILTYIFPGMTAKQKRQHFCKVYSSPPVHLRN